jgi:hypothetical protein
MITVLAGAPVVVGEPLFAHLRKIADEPVASGAAPRVALRRGQAVDGPRREELGDEVQGVNKRHDASSRIAGRWCAGVRGPQTIAGPLFATDATGDRLTTK